MVPSHTIDSAQMYFVTCFMNILAGFLVKKNNGIKLNKKANVVEQGYCKGGMRNMCKKKIYIFLEYLKLPA